ncbi:hypothetical protein ASD89_22620 [Caulobacter sp. Root656]|nr:hypothetical protein ASD89_22620 [Caulobacter sp. Root656]
MPTLRRTLWIAALMLPAAAQAEAGQPYISWGKAGVSFEQYRSDSVACGTRGATRDMREQQAFKDVVHGTNFQDSALERGDAVEYVMIYQRNFRGSIPTLQKFMVNDVEECLVDRGYSPFALNREQTKQLYKYEKGSQERFHYLYQISIDPEVLRGQKLDITRK